MERGFEDNPQYFKNYLTDFNSQGFVGRKIYLCTMYEDVKIDNEHLNMSVTCQGTFGSVIAFQIGLNFH